MNFGGFAGNAGDLFAQFAQNLQGNMPRPPPSAYDDYFTAYSVAMLPGKERENVSYGGKVIMPPSALAKLTNLEIAGPWVFQLRNPNNVAASTHAGVLEFIAPEGHVYLPAWMMRTLRLEEGEPIRITGTELPKGKMVKLQAQHVHFLEISDPKAVLEQALRNFSALTQGDIIEISYNRIIFGLLVMETHPGGEGIDVIDTDLEVDFAAPVGYVEPERPKAPPPPTMASKLNINVDSSSPGSSRPGSSMAGQFAGTNSRGTTVSKGGDQWESFKGKGETLGGRKTKGKGISHRKAEDVSEGSKIIRTEKHRVVTNSTFENDVTVPAALDLPFGHLFFGYSLTPYQPPAAAPQDSPRQPSTFAGSGNSLLGSSASKGKAKEQPSKPQETAQQWGSGGQTLGSRSAPSVPRTFGAGGAAVPVPPRRGAKQRERSPSPEYDFGVDDDDDVIIDSD
ncbi:ubiquitin fusion degradation protein [Steccherinum ochraceum]|uniref:Ubiquitin fusion degradation protein n=1 Tax=Steccherinum ochraceum TaxID=92696 RepID=A0A4R0RJE7_9APHY|nr:ubiquitin fusion degradation protein [Steccherinum ochraceum]